MSNQVLLSNVNVSRSVDVKFYIKDTNGVWVDFSDKSNIYGVDALESIGIITNKVEESLGVLVTTIQNVTLKNYDGFFNKPFPSTLKTVTGSNAVFGLSKGYKRSILRGRECKIAVQTRVTGSPYSSSTLYTSVDAIQEEILGHFFIDDVIPYVDKKVITLRLLSLDGKLQRKDASKIKDGYDFYESRSVGFLIKEILKSEYALNGSLPSTYSIDESPYLATLGGNDNISDLGRPPGFTGSTWYRSSLYTRAICFANVAGTGNKLYLGCDEQLWSYDPSTGVYTLIDDSTIPSGFYIKKIWYSSVIDSLILVAQEDEYWGGPSARQQAGWRGRFYRWVGSGSLITQTTELVIVSFKSIFRTGDSAHIVGSYNYWGWGVYRSSGEVLGENVSLPFPQDIQTCGVPYKQSTTYSDKSVIAYDAKPGTSKADRDYNNDDYGYVAQNTCAHQTTNQGSDTYFGPSLYHVGQPPCFLLSNRKVGGRLYAYYWNFPMDVSGYMVLAVVGGLHWWDYTSTYFATLVTISVDTGAQLINTFFPPIDHAIPLCMKINGSSDYAIVFMLKESNDANIFKCIIQFIDLNDVTTDPFKSSYDLFSNESSQDNRYWTVIDCEFFPSNTGNTSTDRAVLSVYNRRLGQYALLWGDLFMHLIAGTLYSDLTKLRHSSQPFTGLVNDSVDDCIYAYGSGEGKIYKIEKDGTLSVLNEAPAIDDEFGLLSGLTVNTSHSSGKPEIYGVSSPTTHLDSFYSYQAGKYNLFRLHQSISNIIPYADFEGLSKFDVIKLLSQSRDGLSFFDRNSNFYYLPRIYSSSSADYTLGETENGVLEVIKSVKFGLGYNKVINVVKVNSYIVSYTPPDSSSSLTLLERSHENKDEVNPNNLPFADYLIEQKDTAAKKIYVYCVKGGTVSDGESRWKFNIIENEIEAIVKSNTGSGETFIYLMSVFGGDDAENGIHTGDIASVIDVDTGVLITRAITSVNTQYNYIAISSAFGIELKERTIITISKKFSIDSSYGVASWSDEGVTYVVSAANNYFYPASTRDLSVGTVVRFGGDDVNEYRILSIASDKKCTVDRNFPSSNIPSSGDVVRAYYSPNTSDGLEIGGSNLFVKWIPGSGTAEVDYSETFIPGDRLVIECPGKSLEVDDKSLQVLIDSSSVGLHEKREMTIDNRFMPRVVAQEIGKRILKYYSQPKYRLEITIPLSPYIDIVTDGHLTTVDVRLPDLFTVSNEFKERFLIESISHDTRNMLTSLKLVGIDVY